MRQMKTVFGVALPALLLALSAGCGEVGEEGEENGGTDSDADMDVDADTDSDSDSDSDAGAGSETCVPLENLYFEGFAGFLVFGADAWAESLGFSADAQFFHVNEGGGDCDNAVVLIEADGTDTCSLSYMDGSGSGGEGSIDWLAAGTVTLSSGGQSAELEPYGGGEVVYYSADLLAQGMEPAYGAEYALSVTGDEAPALELDPAVALPAALAITAPAEGTPIPRAALGLTWTGATPGETIRILANANESSPFEGYSQRYEIRCAVADDGEFEIPGEIMEALPTGWYLELWVNRDNRAYHATPDGPLFATVAYSQGTGFYQLEAE